MQLEIATLTEQGARGYNEDRIGHWTDGRHAALVVADGAGGHGGGDVAASCARDCVLDRFAAAPSLDPAWLRSLVAEANDRVLAGQREGGRLASMRSTIVMAAFDLASGRMVWVHSGDSRAYLFRGHAIVARTTDHSLVQQMVASGMLDDEQARLHPQRNVLLSALGACSDELEINVSDPMRVEPNDAVLLCSDGVWEPLGDATLVASLSMAGSPAQWASALQNNVAGRAKPDQDNYSAVLACVSSAEDETTRILGMP
ncbi:protein phosphatase 2C domain-containing protein [Ottowia caeni]|uniref:PP2C family protein-serine/threonine phosphatase n=1 Tax=Ottowia caeni TaxID=2870339 RepID=UPI001E2DF84E|nr:protein phosphatase 2C domain-containing protein [Ottowia caeni]